MQQPSVGQLPLCDCGVWLLLGRASDLFLPVEFRVRIVSQSVVMPPCRSIWRLITTMYSGKTADSIEMPFSLVGRVGERIVH